jgi:hypothetical protein
VTLINHYTDDERAVIVSDSLCTLGGRPACFQPKVFVLPHAAMALTGRGPVDIQLAAYRALGATYYAGGIDGAARILPGIL